MRKFLTFIAGIYSPAQIPPSENDVVVMFDWVVIKHRQ